MTSTLPSDFSPMHGCAYLGRLIHADLMGGISHHFTAA